MSLVLTIGSAAYAQEPLAPRTSSEETSGDTGNAKQVQMLAPKRAFEVGVNGGYGQALGQLGDYLPLRDAVINGGAAGLSLGLRYSPHWSVEGTGQYQELMTGITQDGGHTTVRGVTMGIQGTYHFLPFRLVDPYASLGTGYRMTWIVPPGAVADLVHGFELAKAVVGVDFRMSPSVAMGPMIGADVNVFVWDNPSGGTRINELPGPRAATFLFAGLGGHFDLGGDRVPHAAVAYAAPPPAVPAPAPVVVTPAPPPEIVPVTFVKIEQPILDACKIEGPDAYFDFDKSNLKDDEKATLDRVSACFTTGVLKGRQMKVVGHTDPRGSDQYNMKLGQSRAESVLDYLSGKGVPKVEMNTESRGKQDAVGTDEATWSFDRRVDIRLGD